MVPRIKPKSNTVRNAFGSQAWREMVDLPMQEPDTFKSEYRQRSIIEAVLGAIKKMYGNHTRCYNPEKPAQRDCDSDNLLQHRTRGQIEDEERQVHAKADRYHDCMTGAVDTAPAQRSLRIMPWNWTILWFLDDQ